MPDPTRVIDTAAAEGWMAALLCFVFIVVIGFLVWLVKVWIDLSWKREDRMAKRIDELENIIHGKMMTLLSECTQAFTGLTNILKRRPCLVMDEEKIDDMVKE